MQTGSCSQQALYRLLGLARLVRKHLPIFMELLDESHCDLSMLMEM